jgi:hypothetical protein
MIALMKERPPLPRAAANKWWPFFGGCEEHGGVSHQGSSPPYDVISITPGIVGLGAFRRFDPLPILHEI